MVRYILTGTSGKLGSRVLRKILEKQLIAPEDLIISSSNPDRVPAIAKEYGIEVRQGNYEDPESLKSSFVGGDVLFLVSHGDAGVKRVEYHKNAIERARDAGVKTVIYTSMMFGGETGLDSVIGIQQGHIGTVNYLAQQRDVDYVIVREGLYAHVWNYYAGPAVSTEFKKGDTQPVEWVVPNDSSIAWVDIDDLAEGNALILADYTKYIGQTLRLTGPRSTPVSEIAKLVEQRTGRKVDLRFSGKEEAVLYHKEHGTVPREAWDWLENNWAGWFVGLAHGEGEVVDPLLGQLLGRPPRGVVEMADEYFTPK
ncbi:uncharacterized protein Z520_09598 [Fonsecaea multimorphosa CBS 102226]|uniref:NAD(P)-binding domain-containing protein n=1 Tax=Fonsecaea multimorphosa CBS 102226 TaxID=1442371 RepID=A0A0D2JML7_9EURO|nr:uncharacterized protein Z520_09598 [Fonsecaea multimorphosa CBS 102226]KIX94552.1 hypothetical protein Z520_09598 [Fonsecaea multimorphosa CBS 102226]OAL20263.1 hypothetical protein AYO22_08975 [Fonsecaea multimorphosa]